MSVTFTSGAGAVTLPNPILGDSDQYDTGTIFKISMSNKIHSTRQDKIISTFLLNFINLTQAKWEELLTWWKANQGLQVTYDDYEGSSFTGIITNEPLEITINGKRYCDASNKEHGSVTIQFEAQRP